MKISTTPLPTTKKGKDKAASLLFPPQKSFNMNNKFIHQMVNVINNCNAAIFYTKKIVAAKVAGFLVLVMLLLGGMVNGQITVTQTTNGNYTFTVPVGVSSITVQTWGAGGGGSGTDGVTYSGGKLYSGLGGGGGAYATKTIAVTAGTIYNYTVGAGGAGGAATSTNVAGTGGSSYFANTTVGSSTGAQVIAVAGSGGDYNNLVVGAGGLASACTPTTGAFSGGSGGASANSASTRSGGGGGSSAGTGTGGANGTNGSSAAAAGGTAPTGGGNGGNGGLGATSAVAGFNPGGGGGGETNVAAYTGAAGANGKVAITYTLPIYTSIVANGVWNTATTWSVSTGGNGVPTAGSIVIINTNVIVTATPTNQVSSITINNGFTLSLNAAYTNPSGSTIIVSNGGTIALGATLTNNGTVSVAGTVQLNAGGYATSSVAAVADNFSYTGTANNLIFNNNSLYGVAASTTASVNGQTFWPSSNSPYNITVQGSGAQLQSGAGSRTIAGTLTLAAQYDNAAGTTVSGTLQINSGGYVSTTAPTYGSSSTLIYNVTYGVATEWTGNSTTAGLGVPQNVTIQAAVTMPNGANLNRGIAGNISITSGSLTLGNNLTNNDLYVGGNWTLNTGATFNNTSRLVKFNGGTAQTIGGTQSTAFAYLEIANTSGGISLSKSATVSNQLTLTSGILTTTSTNSLTITNTANTAISGGSSTSFINGPVTWTLPNLSSANYIFPLGVTATYLPFAITNPGGASPVVTIQAFAASTGGSLDGTLASISATEYWSATLTGSLSAGTVSAAKASIAGVTVIGKSSTLTGTYSSLGGATNNTLITSNTITSTIATGTSLGFFVLGTPTVQFYSKSSGSLQTLSNWGSNTDGTGTPPSNFTAAGQVFNIRNQVTATISAAWTVSGTGSKVVVGDGTTAITFQTTSSLAFTGTLDISNNGTFNNLNAAIPTFGTLNAGSTVVYGATASQAITAVNYGNLSLSGGGTKTFPTGTVGIAGAFNPGSFTASTQGTIDFTSAGTQTIPAFNYFNLTNSGNGARILASSGTVGITGTIFLTGSGAYTVTGSTVNLSDGTGYTIPTPTAAATNNYNNLTISGAGTYPFGGSITIGGNYNQSNATVQVSNGSSNPVISIGGTFTLTSGEFDLITSSTATGANVIVSGAVSISSSAASGDGLNFETVASASGAAVFQANGNVTINGTATNSTRLIDWGATGTLTGNQLNIKGNLTVSGTALLYSTTSNAAGADGIIFNGTGTITSPQTLTYSTTNNATVYSSWVINSGTVVQLQSNLPLGTSGSPYSNFTVNGTLDAQAFVISAGSGTTATANTGFTLNSGGTLITKNTGGITSTITAATTNYNNAANYIFNGTSTQTANFPNATMNDLTISNANGVSLGAVIISPIVNGTLYLINGAFNNGTSGTAHTLTINGPINTTSGSILGGGTASNLTIGSTASFANANPLALSGNFGVFTWSRTAGGILSGSFSVAGNWINNASGNLDLTTNTTTVTLNGSAQTISGSTTFNNLTINAAGAKDFGATITTIAGIFNQTAGSMTTSGANTFIFTGASGSIAGSIAKNFVNLTITGSGVTTNSNSGTINITGSYLNNGIFTANPLTTVNFKAGTAQTISGTGTTSFGIFTISSNTTNTTVNAGSHDFSVTGASFDVATSQIFNGQTNGVTFSGGATTTVIVGGGTYNFNDLTISGSSILSNAANNRNLSVSGGWTNSGTYTKGTETITFNGSSLQTVTGATTFNSVTVSGAGGLSLGSSHIINGTLTLSASSGGNIDLNGSNNITLGSTASISGETCARQFINSGVASQGNGYVQTSRNLVAANPGNVANLGINIQTATILGNTTIRRFVSKAVSSVGVTNSIKRIYSITPTNPATGNVTLTSSYCDGELNGNTESAPTLITYYGTGVNETTGYTSVYPTASNDASANTVTTPATGSLIAGQNNITLANAGSNAYYTVANGDWNTPGTWVLGSVPPAGVATTIKTLVTVNGIVTNAPSSITINSSQSLTFGSSGTITTTNLTNNGSVVMTNGGTLTIATGGTFANGTNTFTGGTGTVNFAGTGTISGTVSFKNVTINGGVNFGASSTITGILLINNGGGATTNGPVYSGGTLTYNTAGTATAKFNQALEWPAINGPANVNLTNNTWVQLTSNRSLAGNLTITNGALQSSGAQTLTMNGITQTITVSTATGGAIFGTDNGTGNDLTLTIASGTTTFTGDATGSLDDEKKLYNINVNSGANLTLARGILCKYGTFTVDGTLQINANGFVENDLSYGVNAKSPSYNAATGALIYNTASSFTNGGEWVAASTPFNVTVQNSSAVMLSGSRAIGGLLTLTTGSLAVGANTLSLNGSAISISTGTLVTTSSSNLTFGGTNAGPLLIPSSVTALGNLTLNNTNATPAILNLNSSIAIATSLTLNSGRIVLGSNNLTLAAAATVGGNAPSATNMVVATSGEFRKSQTGTGSFTFPVGDNTGTAEYSPLTVNVTSSAGTGSYIGVSLVDGNHPNNSSAANYLTRYWNVTQSGFTACTATITGTYINATTDVTGTLGSIKAAQLNGTFNQSTNPWVKTGGSVLSGTTLTYTGASITAGLVSAFTGITSADPTVNITGGGITVCQNAPTTLTANPSGDATFTYLWTGLITGSTTSSTATATTTSGGGPNSYTVTVKDANGISSATSAAVTITVTPTVGTPSTPTPSASTICQASSPTTYTTTATNATSYNWSVTGTGNTISGTGTTGTVTWVAGFTGTATISVTANGCNGPSAIASTSVTVTATVGTPSTPSPSATTICQASSPTTYTTSATNATSYNWSVTGTGNTISGTGTTGTVTWAAGFTGTATISVTANGCNGPSAIASTSVTVTATVGTSSTPSPSATTICQASSPTTYTTAATNATSYNWSVTGTGNTISGTGTTGTVTWAAGFTGSATISVTANGCNGPSATASTSVTVNPSTIITTGAAPSSQIVALNGTPANLTVTATGLSLTYQWFSNATNSNIGGSTLGTGNGAQTNTYTPPANIAGTVYYYCVVTGTCGTATSSAVTVIVTNSITWAGGGTSNWSTASNWSPATVPVSTNNAVIPSGNTPYPVLSASSAITGLNIGAGATVGIGTNTFTINGAVTGTGTITGSNTSNLIINGTAGTVYFTNGGTDNYLKNFTIGASASATLGNTLNITAYDGTSSEGVLTVTNGGSLASGGFLTIKSSSTGTARIAAGNTAGGYITGNVTVERFIPQNSSKAWRLLASNTTGQSINASWQEGQVGYNVNTNPGFGTMIAGPGASLSAVQTAGFDTLSYGRSIFRYDPATDNLVPITNTLTAQLGSEQGYFLFIRGDRGPNQFNTGAGTTATPPTSSTVLRSTGTLFLGNQAAINTGTGKYGLVRNPYPSRIDMRQIIRGGNLIDAYQVWDPKLGGAYGVGGYQTLTKNPISGDYENSTTGGSYGTAGTVHNFIESGSAFFIQATTTGSAQVVEACKANGSAVVNRPSSASNRLLYSLISNITTTSDVVDGGYIDFDASYSNSVDIYDVRKSPNFNENFGLTNSGVDLVVERRALLTVNDTINFSMSGLQQHDYKIQLDPSAISAVDLNAFLEDRFLNSFTQVSLLNTSQYTFTASAVAASRAANRFRLVFRPMAPLPVTIASIRAYAQASNIGVEWKVESQVNIVLYEIEKSLDGRNFTKVGTQLAISSNSASVSYNWLDINSVTGANYYRVKCVDADGRFKYTSIVYLVIGNVKPSITVYPNPVQGNNLNVVFANQEKGNYQIRLINNIGQIVYSKESIHEGGSITQSFLLPLQLVGGVYQLEIIQPNKNKQVQKVIINSAN